MLQFGSKHVYIEDVHIFKHCHEMTLFLLWIGTYCISCVVQQTSGVKDLSSLVRYDDSSLAVIRHVQSIVPIVRPRPNIRSHSVLFFIKMLQQTIVESVKLLIFNLVNFPPRSDTLMCPGVSAILSSHTLFSVASLSLILVSFPSNVNI